MLLRTITPARARRLFVCGGVAAFMAACLPSGPAAAQSYPSRPVTIIVPVPGGSLSDVLTRALTDSIAEATGQTFVIDNKPGAAQIVGTRAAARAEPDGYTLIWGGPTNFALNAAMKRNLSYDPVKDFVPISLVYSSPMYLMTRRDLPPTNVKELIDYAKKNPGKLSFSTNGVGSSTHVAIELFKHLAGIEMVHVPYTGIGHAIRDVIAGHVDLTFPGSYSAVPDVNMVKMLAVTTAKRTLAVPDLPTIAESGLPGYEASLWFGLLAPAGTPKEIVKKIEADVRKAVQSGALRKRLKAGAEDMELIGSTSEEFARLIATEIPRWKAVVQAASIPID
jgi:tripartite-type tricarboxylate transporter receptor subunit TctC